MDKLDFVNCADHSLLLPQNATFGLFSMMLQNLPLTPEQYYYQSSII